MRRAGGASDDATGGNDGGRANATAMGLMPGFARARANKAFQGSGKAVGISALANADTNNDIGYSNKAKHNKNSTTTTQRTTMCHKRRPAGADTGATRAMTAAQKRQRSKSNGASATRAKMPAQCWW